MTLPVFKAFMKTVLGDAPREEFPEGEAPTYKDDKEWEFSHTKSASERAAEAAAAEEAKRAEEEAQQQEEQEQEPQTPTTPQQPVTPTPTPEAGGTTQPQQ